MSQIEKEIFRQMAKKQNIVLVFGSNNYEQLFLNLNREIASEFDNICLITASKPFNVLAEQFKRENIDISKYHFIDCISATTSAIQDSPQCTYISSPSNLGMLVYKISGIAQEKKLDVIILDSISTLIIYNNELSIIQFLHYIMTKMRNTDTKAIFTVFEGDMKRSLIKDVELFADLVLDLSKYSGIMD